MEARGGGASPGTEIMGGCKMPATGAGRQTWLLWKRSKHTQLLSTKYTFLA